MGFLTSLAKGFVRSAVNQVGRDGGKVISNQLYGNKHSTPLRNINGDNTYNDKESSTSYKEGNGLNFIRDKVSQPLWKYILLTILAAITCPAGSIILFIYGFRKYKQKYITAHYFKEEPIYVRDRRYKSGARFEGFEKRKYEISLNANKDEIQSLKTIGKIYMILSFVSIMLFAIPNEGNL